MMGRSALWLCLLAACAVARGQSELPMPKDTQLSIVGENLSVNGVNMQAFELRSSRNVREVLAFYADEWPGRARIARLPPWTIISHPDEDRLVTVQLQPVPGGGSFGYVGITNLLEPGLKLQRPSTPLPPGAELISEIEAEDHGRRSRTVLLRAPASAEQSLAWFDSLLQRQGWSRVRAPGKAAPAGGRVLLMSKGRGELNLVATGQGGGSLVTMVLILPE